MFKEIKIVKKTKKNLKELIEKISKGKLFSHKILPKTYCCDKPFTATDLQTKNVFWNKLTEQFMCDFHSKSLEWNS